MIPDICANRHGGEANSFLANARVHERKPNLRERIYRSFHDPTFYVETKSE